MKGIEDFVIQQIKKKRIERGISQAALADYLNCSRGFIGDIENPKQRAKYNLVHINEIARILNCSPKDFLPEKPIIEDITNQNNAQTLSILDLYKMNE